MVSKKCCVSRFSLLIIDIYINLGISFARDRFQSLGLWLRLECSFDSLSIDPAHVIYLAEGHNVGSERQSSVMTLRKPIVTWII